MGLHSSGPHGPRGDGRQEDRGLVCGAGLLGMSALEGLLEAGFRYLVVTDAMASDVQSVVERYPDASVMCLKRAVRELDGWNYDVVLGCLVDILLRLFANSRAKEYSVPYVNGLVTGGRGRVQMVLPEGPCFECGINRAFRSHGRYTVPDMVPALVAGTAQIMVAEALKIASGHPSTCARGIVYHNVSDDSRSVALLEIDSRCPNRGRDRARRYIMSDVGEASATTYGRGRSPVGYVVGYM